MSYPSASPPSLATTPLAVLSLVCQHLQVADILRLLRCTLALQGLSSADASFSSAAWSEARLDLFIHQRLHEWTLPYERCVHDITRVSYVPLTLWQQALPMLQYTVQRWKQEHVTAHSGEYEDGSESSGDELVLAAVLTGEQRTKTVRVRGEEHVVLSQLSWGKLDEIVPWRVPCYRSRFVLTAVPHLQHLHLAIDANSIRPPPPVSETFALVPRLRSLRLRETDSEHDDTDECMLPIRDMLAALPRLTFLHCEWLRLSEQDKADIADHATLKRITLNPDSGASYFDMSG